MITEGRTEFMSFHCHKLDHLLNRKAAALAPRAGSGAEPQPKSIWCISD